ncbi:hypothetical protein [Acetomicrobium hydrogeniformans]|uniref:Uncharacterized protein n=1 Tax=Acetomicrobium hydrogeniformans ATCC BAA-1850 TaxID=592015 RepID=A0A0T5X9R2_9BACT|nr:hypothetical protein [Acetomicrobium hydrogeniformans]KRT35081.1 hypothetical protein HMPREF1705_04755 [Acetomicrobium hydrogeniformans ATCC BAA-1850]
MRRENGFIEAAFALLKDDVGHQTSGPFALFILMKRVKNTGLS